MSIRRAISLISLLFLLLLAVAGGAADLVLYEGDVPPADARIVLRGADYAVCLGEATPDAVVLDRDAETREYLRVLVNDPAAVGKAAELGVVVWRRDQLYLVRWNGELPPGFNLEGLHGVLPLRTASPARMVESSGGPSPAWSDDQELSEIVDAVSEDEIKDVIQELEDFVTRSARHDQYYQSCLYAEDYLDGLGLDGEIQTFTADPWYGSTFTCYNVIAEQPGQVTPEEIYIICGHLDSTAGYPWNSEDDAPGADDNGSGAAAVLEAARVLSQYEFDATLRYICFGAEEQGLCGSTYYADQAYAAGDDIQGVINVDMVLWDGLEGYTVWVPYDGQSSDLATGLETFAAEYVPDLNVATSYDPAFEWSDHSPFWDNGYPALLLIENDYDENPHYHSTTDLLANYEDYWPFGTDVLRAAVGYTAALADPLEDFPVGAVELSAAPGGDGVLVDWAVEGEPPAGLRVLRGRENPIAVSGALDGRTTRWLDRGVTPGEAYSYWLEITGDAGAVERYGPTEAVVAPPQTQRLTLHEPYPSPAADALTLSYTLPEGCASATLTIYDLTGRRITTETLEATPGRHTLLLDVEQYQPGVYLARLAGEGSGATRRFVISR